MSIDCNCLENANKYYVTFALSAVACNKEHCNTRGKKVDYKQSLVKIPSLRRQKVENWLNPVMGVMNGVMLMT